VLDTRNYEKGIKVTKAEMTSLVITGDAIHPEWNYTINPRRPAIRSSYFTEHPTHPALEFAVCLGDSEHGP